MKAIVISKKMWIILIKNDKLIQIDINADTELELSIVDLKTRKEEYAVSNPVSFECKKGLITIYGDGFIEE